MDLEVKWHAPLPLRKASAAERLIYACDQLDLIPEARGVYFFGRTFGTNIAPVYIGRAANIRTRISQHLETNVQLLRAIEAAKNGGRVVVAGEWIPRKGQQMKRALPLIEAALIKFALAEGHELVNNKGTKTRVHTVSMHGNRTAATRVFRSKMNIEHR